MEYTFSEEALNFSQDVIFDKIKEVPLQELDQELNENEKIRDLWQNFRRKNFTDVEALKNKYKKNELLLMKRFLRFCYENRKDPCARTITAFINEYRFLKKKGTDPQKVNANTATKFKRKLNQLLPKEERIKISKLKLNSTQIIDREKKKIIPEDIQRIILDKLRIENFELYKAVLLAKSMGGRIGELVKLQIKHFIRIYKPAEAWYVWYLQPKTGIEKNFKINDEVYDIVSFQLNLNIKID